MERTEIDPGTPGPRPAAGVSPEPRTMGAYRILRRLGEGGMGSVYLGYREGEERQVAIKVLSDQLSSNQAYVDRFYREARSAALLNHPNIVRGLEVGQDRATSKHYLVLEYVDGPSVHQLLEEQGRLPVGDAVRIALDIARALEHAQSRNIVHRDIKPDNILLTRSGVAKLADLGLAKRTDETSHLTATRQGFGTPYYMPYEQAMNARRADGRSDIYALGGTLYHLLTGQVPFPGNNHLDVMDRKNHGVYPPASELNPEVPKVLDRILGYMLAKEPRDRYQTASELIVDLDRSGLASVVPTFADPELAMKDPWVLACLSAAAQPTLLDPSASPKAGTEEAPAVVDDVWFLRARDARGAWTKTRATTQQILRQLRAGRLPPRLEASHDAETGFQVLAAYPEFRDVKAARPQPPEDGEASDESRSSGKGRGWLRWFF
jgi:eukaryotic-like serine/threonine-protein kinase